MLMNTIPQAEGVTINCGGGGQRSLQILLEAQRPTARSAEADSAASSERAMGESPPAVKKLPTSICRQAAITSFAMSSGCIYGSMGMIVLPEEVLVLWPDSAAFSLGMLLGLTGISQLVAPVAGYVSDRCTLPQGRRRPIMLLGTVLLVLGLAGMWAGRSWMSRALYSVGTFVTLLGLNMSYTVFAGLVPDLIADGWDINVGTTSGLVAFWNAVGASGAFLAFGFAGLPVKYSYATYSAVALSTCAISSLAASETPLANPLPIRLSEIPQTFHISEDSHGDFYWVFLMRALYYMGVSALSFMMLYLSDITLPRAGPHPFLALDVGGEEEVSRSDQSRHYVAAVALFGQLATMFIVVPLGRLSDRLGRKPFIHFAIILMIGCYFSYMFAPSIEIVLGAGVVFGVANGAFLAVDYALAVDTLPDKGAAAKDLGIWGVAAFIGSSAGPACLGPTLHIVGLLFPPPLPKDGTLSEGEEGLHYGLAGYQAMQAVGALFFLGASVMLHLKIKAGGPPEKSQALSAALV
jgi:MFS family permease